MSHQISGLSPNFNILFFICKILGIYPHSLQNFQRHKILKSSKLGTLFVFAVMIGMLSLYNLVIYSFNDDHENRGRQSTVTFVIGLFLNYIGPAMMAVDQLSAIFNQAKLEPIFERIACVDEKLFKENIVVDNSVIQRQSLILIGITVVSEISITLSTYIYLVDSMEAYALLWIVTCIPTLYNAFDKIWFASLLYALRMRFQAINDCLEDLVVAHNDNIGFRLFKKENEIKPKLKAKMFSKTSKIASIDENVSVNSFFKNTFKGKSNVDLLNFRNETRDIAKIEIKLNNLCQLHDEICEIGKRLNELWSYSILILMAYGFLIFTAQLYFLYCGTQGQPIPSMFRSAKSALITTLFLFYTSGKCVYLIYLSWKTSLDSKRTGICLHKFSVAVDDNALYEIVNHLSLKLLNHSVDFSACGFFNLNMETLYGVSGGITSYLIILIQFNLAAQQAKDSTLSLNNGTTLSANETTGSDFELTTSLTTVN